MPQFTDPARELAELCDRLAHKVDKRGDIFLASQFDVAPWSREFYQIVSTIIERADFLISIVQTLDLDDDFKAEAITHIEAIKRGFDFDAMAHPWQGRGAQLVSGANAQPVKMLSVSVREKVSYPRLTEEEVGEIIGLVTELQSWLEERQLSEHDFIRQAILDGLAQFRFRLERIGWLGWGYAIESLREVIGAYFALMGASRGAAKNPDAEAVLKRLRKLLQQVWAKTKAAKDVADVGDFILRMYGAAMLGIHHVPGVAGLLPG